jgi:hypothetical protein
MKSALYLPNSAFCLPWLAKADPHQVGEATAAVFFEN